MKSPLKHRCRDDFRWRCSEKLRWWNLNLALKDMWNFNRKNGWKCRGEENSHTKKGFSNMWYIPWYCSSCWGSSTDHNKTLCYSQGKEPDSKWNNHKIQSTQIVRAGYMQQRRGVRQARAEFWTRRPEQAPRASRRPERRVWARLVDIFEEHSRRGKNKRKALVWEFAWRVPWGDAGEEGVR